MTASNGVVLDASAMLRWLLNGELQEARQVQSLLEDGFALVPDLWHLEVANGLRNAVRAGLVGLDYISDVADEIEQFDIRTDPVGVQIRRVGVEAMLLDLTAYDTTYLLLARDRDLPLATFDKRLAKAATTAGIPLAV